MSTVTAFSIFGVDWQFLKPFVVIGLAFGGVYALSGVGLVVLYRATGVLNVAFGAIGAAGALIAYYLLNHTSCPEWLAFTVCVAFGGILELDWYREDTGEPGGNGLPSPPADQHQVIRDIPLSQVLRRRYDDPRRGVVSPDRAVDLNQAIQIGKVGKSYVVEFAWVRTLGLAIGWHAITDQRDLRSVGEVPHRLGFPRGDAPLARHRAVAQGKKLPPELLHTITFGGCQFGDVDHVHHAALEGPLRTEQPGIGLQPRPGHDSPTRRVLPHRDGGWAELLMGTAESFAQVALREPHGCAFSQLTKSVGEPVRSRRRLAGCHRHDASTDCTGQSIA
jgi:hypothetical protein